MSAEHAQFRNNLGLAVLNHNGFNITVAHTLIAVLTFCGFEINDFFHGLQPPHNLLFEELFSSFRRQRMQLPVHGNTHAVDTVAAAERTV